MTIVKNIVTVLYIIICIALIILATAQAKMLIFQLKERMRKFWHISKNQNKSQSVKKISFKAIQFKKLIQKSY